MSIIPKFILNRVYVKGSLRETAEGIAFDFINAIGTGILTRLNKIVINETEFLPHQIMIKIGDKLMAATDINEQNPAIVFHNQRSTCFLQGAKLAQGLHTITIDMLSREAGKIVVSIQDQFAENAAT